jgi:ribonuclease HI
MSKRKLKVLDSCVDTQPTPKRAKQDWIRICTACRCTNQYVRTEPRVTFYAACTDSLAIPNIVQHCTNLAQTSNRAELYAVIHALRQVTDPLLNLELCSTNIYIIYVLRIVLTVARFRPGLKHLDLLTQIKLMCTGRQGTVRVTHVTQKDLLYQQAKGLISNAAGLETI